MKKTFCLLFLSAILLSSCDANRKQKYMSQEEIDRRTPCYDLRKPDFRVYAWEDTIKGHIYVLTANSGIGSSTYIIHSPNCKCFKK